MAELLSHFFRAATFSGVLHWLIRRSRGDLAGALPIAGIPCLSVSGDLWYTPR
jgi:hypothetical protein